MAKPKIIRTGAARSRLEDVAIAQAEAPSLERVSWFQDAGLRKLYFWAFILCIASATTGYDRYSSSIKITWKGKTMLTMVVQFYVEQLTHSL
jgi:hypothetical protein